jgi:hypothetical protein
MRRAAHLACCSDVLPACADTRRVTSTTTATTSSRTPTVDRIALTNPDLGPQVRVETTTGTGMCRT